MLLLGEICLEWRCEGDVGSQKGQLAEQGPGAGGCCDPAASERHSTRQRERSALQSNLRCCRTEVSRGRISRECRKAQRGEGPNMRRQGGVVSDSSPAMNPTGGAGARHRDTQPALHVELMEAVVAPDNLQRAWAQVKSNKGAPGCDGMRIEDFPAYARAQWPTIRQALLDGSYRPRPVRGVMIPKPGGGERALGIPSVVDRVIQQINRASHDTDLRSAFLGIELWVSPEAKRPWSREADTGLYQGRLSHRRRSGPREVLRQRPARHPDEPGGSQDRRQAVAGPDRSVSASGREDW